MLQNNIFQNIPKDLKDEFFEDLLLGENIQIERIVSRGHTSPKSGWYKQEKNEWVIMLDGKAIISIKDSPDVKLEKGSYINISAYVEHKVSWTKPDYDTVWLAVFY